MKMIDKVNKKSNRTITPMRVPFSLSKINQFLSKSMFISNLPPKNMHLRFYSTLLITGRTELWTSFDYDPDLLDFSRQQGYLISFNGQVLVSFPSREHFRRLLYLFMTLDIGSYEKDKFILDKLYVQNKIPDFKTKGWQEMRIHEVLNKSSNLRIDIAIESRSFGLNLATWFFQEFIESCYLPTFENKIVRADTVLPVFDYNHLKEKGIIDYEFSFTTLDLGKFFIYREQVIYFLLELINKIAYFADANIVEKASDELDYGIMQALYPYLEVLLFNLQNQVNINNLHQSVYLLKMQ